jgi:mono/diheme cytochrome c family protein
MRTLSFGAISGATALAGSLVALPATAQTRYELGRVATPAEIAAWDIDVAGDGRNLPAGTGTVQQGKQIYETRCAHCHGMKGEGGVGGVFGGGALAGGEGTLNTPKPLRTVGSYWPYAPTVFDFVRRAMPLEAPQSLSDPDVYAVTGYVLFLNGLVPENATIDAGTLSSLRMPNRDGFIPDPRPDVLKAACMKACN